jgi:hypothetical protein
MPITFDKILGQYLKHKHKASDVVPTVPSINGVVLGTPANGLIATIPAGTLLEKIFFRETGNAAIDFQFGTTIGGFDISPNVHIDALGYGVISGWDFVKDGPLTTFNVYVTKIGGGAWGTTSLNFKFITIQL